MRLTDFVNKLASEQDDVICFSYRSTLQTRKTWPIMLQIDELRVSKRRVLETIWQISALYQ